MRKNEICFIMKRKIFRAIEKEENKKRILRSKHLECRDHKHYYHHPLVGVSIQIYI